LWCFIIKRCDLSCLRTLYMCIHVFIDRIHKTLKLCVKSGKDRKRRHWNPLFGHIGDEISKNRGGGNTLGLRGHETEFSTKFGAKLSSPCPFFPPWTPSSNHWCICTVAINVLEPPAFNPESQYFKPLFNKISWLCGQQPGGDEASNEGCNSGPTGHDFRDNSIVSLAPWFPNTVFVRHSLQLIMWWIPCYTCICLPCYSEGSLLHHLLNN
jgi:hypothetical protein